MAAFPWAAWLASNYTFVGDRMLPIDPAATSTFLDPPSFPYGGAGLVMSARDYDRFLHMLQDEGALDGQRVMKKAEITVRVDLHRDDGPGRAEATVWTCDFSHDYVTINADYRS